MSGHKESGFSIDSAWRQHQQTLAEIASYIDELAGLRNWVVGQTNQMSEGLQATFSQEYRAAKEWVADLDRTRPVSGDLLDQSHATVLHEELRLLANTGRTALHALSNALTKEASRLEREQANKMTQVEARLAACQKAIEHWLGEGESHRLTAAWLDAKDLFLRQDYRNLAIRLDALLAEIEERDRKATEFGAKQQRRLYVLSALRQVCHNLGFRELTEPAYERSRDERSRIIFAVDTLDRGQINFQLGLEGIQSDSDIGRDGCHVQFDDISRHLSKDFGVNTKFRTTDTLANPVLRTHDEADTPQDSHTGLENP